MVDTLFIQFINERISPRYSSYCLGNGFSDTWKFCKNLGDFYWATAPKHTELKQMNDFPIAEDLPISSGNIYVSCFNVVNLFLVYQWAIRYPKIKIVAGGPAVGSILYNQKQIPPNLQITDQSVEEYFRIPNLTQEWGLELPNTLKENDQVMFSYSTNNTCYNKTCIFCSHDWSYKKRIKNNLKYEFDGLFPNNKIVFFPCPSSTQNFLLNEFPNFPTTDDYYVLLFIRPDQIINNILPEVLNKRKEKNNKPKLILALGIDFLSERMLKYIRKNHTIQDAKNTLHIISKYKVDCLVTTIVGWPNLIEEDLYQVEEFLKMPEIKNAQWFLNQLQAKVNTYIYDHEKNLFKGKPHNIGPFCVGFDLELTKKQRQLNDQVRQLFRTYIPPDILVDRYNKATEQYYNY